MAAWSEERKDFCLARRDPVDQLRQQFLARSRAESPVPDLIGLAALAELQDPPAPALAPRPDKISFSCGQQLCTELGRGAAELKFAPHRLGSHHLGNLCK